MLHGVAALNEYAANEQAAMAVGGIFLAANQGHAVALHAAFQPRDPRLEAGIVAQTAIEDAALGVVVAGIGRTATQFCAEEEIADSRLLQRALHQLLVELRDVLRVGRASRIDHHFDRVPAEQGKPRRKIVVGVADGEETAHAQALAEENSTEEALRM